MSRKSNKAIWLLAAAMLVFIAVAFAPSPASTSVKAIAAAPAIKVFGASSKPAQSFTYSGAHNDWVRKLLTRAGGWQCPANASDSGTTPTVKAQECQRDANVAAAVLYAWAAECYSRQQEASKAQDAAGEMYKQLQAAQEFCSDAASMGGKRCDTEGIYKCGEL